ncbi:hypothetical protein HZ994_12240 [Akkermansiaceae bacterium]|nr:hypothetical protein HZ994_12240 [Akkermansiaceae bacterium]
MKRLSFPLAAGLWLLISPAAHALIDTDTDGLSDLWETKYGFLIGPNPPADQAPAADPDLDGWTNLQESTAGTDPNDGSVPVGLVRPEISYTPGTFEESEASAAPASPPPENPFSPGPITPSGPPPVVIDPPIVTLTWPTIAGKTYQVAISENLVDWSPASEVFLGSGVAQTFESENIYADGTIPAKVFMRIVIGDTDSDGDTLSDWEENELTLDPFSPDTDRDGIPDGIDAAPKDSGTVADPDGLGLETAGLMVGLKANWTFEEASMPIANLFGKNEARSENRAPGITPAWPVLVPFSLSGQPFFARRGFVSHGLPLADKSVFGDGKVFTGITNSFTLSFWHRFQKDSIKNGNTIHKCLWSLSDCRPSQSSIASNTLAVRRKNATEEEFYLGAYTWNTSGGAPHSSIIGKSFTRPLGTADDGKWHHYTIVRTAGKYTLYIDGTIMPGLDNQSVTWLNIPLTKTAPTSPTDYNYDWNTFGRMAPSLPQNQALGTFDRIRIWSRPLNGTESLDLFHEDIDNDGLWDVSENNTEIWNDFDKDNTREHGEYGFITSPFVWENTVRDTDGDGLSDLDEQNTHQTDIAHPDTDGDLLPDGWEVAHNLNPLVATGDNGGSGDPDIDGATNFQEFSFASDPTLDDTDGDGTTDGAEITNGSNPSDDRDNGQPLATDKRVTILLGVGDQSGSDSEDYNLNIFRIDPLTGDEFRFHTHRSGGHGSYLELPRSIFHKGETYTFQIDWQSSTQGSSGYDPNAPGKGPDYDYTLKIQPQTAYLGKFIESYDPATGTNDPNTPLTGIGRQDVAATQPEFEANYENRRVAIVAPKLVWEEIEGFDNLDTHIDPWTHTEKGKRIFPGRKNPHDNQIRHKLRLVATEGLKGIECYVKSFDIDDSTDEVFDMDVEGENSVIDTNGKAGDDNHPNDFLHTAKSGHFWDNTQNKWGNNTSDKAFNVNGRAEFDYRVGMQPGDNYRAVLSVEDAQGYSEVQTSNSTLPTYIGLESAQTGEIIASESLTVWRRLWVENDSMLAIGDDPSGFKENYFESEVGIPGITNSFAHTNGNDTWLVISPVKDFSSFANLENSRIIFQNATQSVIESKLVGGLTGTYHLSISGNHANIPNGTSFRLYDDDGYGLTEPPLPRNDLAVAEEGFMRKLFSTSFIEIIDSGSYNKTKTVPFKVHDPLLPEVQSVTSNARELVETKSFWIAPLTTAYQFNIHEDDDPKFEIPTDGATTPINGIEQAVVYVENCREWFDNSFRIAAAGANPVIGNEAREDLKNYIIAVAAHEIGHQPGTQDGEIHHAEKGLMRGGGVADPTRPEIEVFSATSVFRFRNNKSWSK